MPYETFRVIKFKLRDMKPFFEIYAGDALLLVGWSYSTLIMAIFAVGVIKENALEKGPIGLFRVLYLRVP